MGGGGVIWTAHSHISTTNHGLVSQCIITVLNTYTRGIVPQGIITAYLNMFNGRGTQLSPPGLYLVVLVMAVRYYKYYVDTKNNEISQNAMRAVNTVYIVYCENRTVVFAV